MTHCPEKINNITGVFCNFKYENKDHVFRYRFQIDNDFYKIEFKEVYGQHWFPRTRIVDNLGNVYTPESFNNMHKCNPFTYFKIVDPIKLYPENIPNDEMEYFKQQIYSLYDLDKLDHLKYSDIKGPFHCYFQFHLDDENYFAVDMFNYHFGNHPQDVELYRNNKLIFSTFV